MAYSIAQAATLIGEFSAPLARMYVHCPFDRDKVATVLHPMAVARVGEALADEVVVLVRSATDAAREKLCR